MGNILCSSDREPIYSVSWCGTIVSGLVVEIVAVGLKVGGVGWCRWALQRTSCTEAEVPTSLAKNDCDLTLTTGCIDI